MTSKARIGRFSDGKLTMDRPEIDRIGRFSDGKLTMDGPEIDRIGRFSSGHEMLAATDQHVRVGSFGDREEARSSLTLHRSTEVVDGMEAETV